MDDLQEKRIANDIDGLRDVAVHQSAALAEMPVPTAIHRELAELGIPRHALARSQAPFVVLGTCIGQIWALGGNPEDALDCLAGISDAHSFAPYWLEIKDRGRLGDRETSLLLDQAARLMRVAFNEIWEILLDLDDTYDTDSPEDTPEVDAKVEAAREKALAVCRFLTDIYFKAIPARCACEPVPAFGDASVGTLTAEEILLQSVKDATEPETTPDE